MRDPKQGAIWILRIGVAAEFCGHGTLALLGKPGWIGFITFWGFSHEQAVQLMPLIGVLDLVLAAIVLVRPVPPLLLWMAFWGFATAMMRPLTGHGWLDFVERGPNWAAPLALWWLTRSRASDRRSKDVIASS